MTTKTRRARRLTGCTWFQSKPRKCCFWGLHASGPGGAMPSAKYPGFDQLRLVLSAIAGIRPDALEEAATTLAAGKSYGIYKVMLTKEDLRRLGLSA
jgi:hypothetical protein